MPVWAKLALTALVLLAVFAIFAAPDTDLQESALRAIRFALVFFALLLGIRAAFNRVALGIVWDRYFLPTPLAPIPGLGSSPAVLRC
jgi:hypothetical protein